MHYRHGLIIIYLFEYVRIIINLFVVSSCSLYSYLWRSCRWHWGNLRFQGFTAYWSLSMSRSLKFLWKRCCDENRNFNYELLLENLLTYFFVALHIIIKIYHYILDCSMYIELHKRAEYKSLVWAHFPAHMKLRILISVSLFCDCNFAFLLVCIYADISVILYFKLTFTIML